jgi:steroid delta-isomerase-like uncharacterized protein
MDQDLVGAAVAAYFAALGTADEESFVRLFAPDVQFEDPVGSRALVGRDGVASFHRGLRRAWSRLDVAVDEVFPRGDRAAVRWTALGVAASGNEIPFAGIDVIAVDEDGLIRLLEGYWDLESVVARM